MTEEEFNKLASNIGRTCYLNILTVRQSKEISKRLNNKIVDTRTKYLVSTRFEESFRNKFIYESIDSFELQIDEVVEDKFWSLIREFIHNPNSKNKLDNISLYYSKMRNYKIKPYYFHHVGNFDVNMKIDLAREIMLKSKNYPRIIIAMAERTCRIYANKHVKPVGKIALDDKWFE